MLQDAVLREVAVEVEYQSLDEAVPGRRVLFPRALLLRGSTLYLIAHQRGREGDALHFAVQRFRAVRRLELEPWPAVRFSLEAFLADGRQQFGAGVEVRLHCGGGWRSGCAPRRRPIVDATGSVRRPW